MSLIQTVREYVINYYEKDNYIKENGVVNIVDLSFDFLKDSFAEEVF